MTRLRGRDGANFLSSNAYSVKSDPVTTRVQLTLFVPGAAAEVVESVRKSLDPIQFKLIPAHVTLCREDELEALNSAALQLRLAAPEAKPITLDFGPPERFDTHGILLPCISGDDEFQALRRLVLGSKCARRQSPHITLAHPRNPRSPNNSLTAAASLAGGLRVRFRTVCRIRQDGNSPWQVLDRFPLPGAEGSEA